LNFFKEIVDSDDLLFKISHVQLQQRCIIKLIRKNIIKKAFELFNSTEENKEDFKTFYEQFYKNIKLVIYEDLVNYDKFWKLFHFHSTYSFEELTPFDEYVEQMKER
jgi:molecular chaperone HtpG